MDEGAPAPGGGTTTTALDAETNATHLFAGDTVILRFGMFIGPDSHVSRANVEDARRGISPSVGRRDAYQPTLWLDAAGAAVAAALVAPAGTYNVADDDPPTRAEIGARGRRSGSAREAAHTLLPPNGAASSRMA